MEGEKAADDGPVLPMTESAGHAPTPDSGSTITHDDDAAAAASRWQRVRTHMQAPVTTHFAYIPLLVSSFVSGMNDTASFASFGAFTAMQTGNTVFLALGASHQPTAPPYLWLKALTSILSFMLACFTIPRLQRWVGGGKPGRGPCTRLGMFLSFAIQSALLLVAAGLVQGAVAPQSYGTLSASDLEPANPWFVELAPIGLMAAQAGGQVTSSRVLGFTEIPTIVLTSAYCDLVSDPRVFARGNAKRDRRLLSAVAFIVGGIASGWLVRSPARMETVLWIGAFLKMVLAVGWIFWKPEREGAKA